MKKIFAVILSVIMLFGLCIPAIADSENEGSTESDLNIPAGEKIWVRDDPTKTGAWYGMDNKPPAFEAPGNLSNRWLMPNSGDWDEALLKISDEAIVNEIKEKQYWIYLKEETTEEDKTVQDIYVKIGSDWDESDMEAEFIEKWDNEFPFSILEKQEELNKKYSKLMLTHFSTFSNGSSTIVIVISAVAVIAFVIILKKKKKAKE